MNRRVSKRLAEWNAQWSDLRTALQQQSWYHEAPKLRFATDDRHLVVLVASGNHVSHDLRLEDLNLPPAGDRSLIDVLVQDDALDANEDAKLILAWIAAVPQPLLMLVGPKSVEVTTSRHGRWILFTLQSSPIARVSDVESSTSAP
jgi:hypothetical protein